jgi:hypothetical protein
MAIAAGGRRARVATWLEAGRFCDDELDALTGPFVDVEMRRGTRCR